MSAITPMDIPFLQLVVEWAEASGEPKELVLRRLCEWAVTGAFADGAFVTNIGTKRAPLDIYKSFLAITETEGRDDESITLGGWTRQNANQWGVHLLAATSVKAQHLTEFCNRTNTLPPRSVLSGLRRLWALRDGRKLRAPPPCPDGHACAERLDTRDLAAAFVQDLRLLLARIRVEWMAFGPRPKNDESGDLDYWEPRWKAARKLAHDDVERSGELDLQQELEALETEWAGLLAQEKEFRATTATRDQGGEKDQSDSIGWSGKMESNKRSRGRPKGVGSLESVDAPLVEEMRSDILNDSSLSPTAAAYRVIDRAKGGGSAESKAKRLVERYSEKYPPGDTEFR